MTTSRESGEPERLRILTSRRLVVVTLAILGLFAAFTLAGAQSQTVGLFLNEQSSFDGYTLFPPNRSETTYLIDNGGQLVHSWDSQYRPGLSAYLLENGNLLRTALLGGNTTFTGTGGGGGRIEEFAWDGTLVWEFEYSSVDYLLHHDIEALPNGNVLMIVWELKTAAESIAAGRDPSMLEDSELWPEFIIEVEPTGASGGTIVWEWHAWDHLVQDFDPLQANYATSAADPDLLDINFGGAENDWHHANSIDYNEQFDQIMLSVRHFSEIWVIDHSTTTAQAASHSGGNSGKGGDILYRWGNPQTYGAGDAGDQTLFFQHNAQWIASGLEGAGNMLVFNNGQDRPGGDSSSVDEVVLPVDGFGNYSLTPGQAYEPSAADWTYTAPNPSDFYSQFISGAQRLPNGNTLIDNGMHGIIFEVTSAGETVWKYVNPVTSEGPLTQGDPVVYPGNAVFRALRYAPSYPGFQGKDLSPMGAIELPKPTPTVTPSPTPTATPLPKDPGADTDGDTVPNGTDLDDDNDGCSDIAELNNDAGSEQFGGQRQPHWFWDFYDVWTHPPGQPSAWERNKVLNIADIFASALRFGPGPVPPAEEFAVAEALIAPVDENSYHIAYDRGPLVGPNAWDKGPPDGTINIVDDIAGVAAQFGHSCA